MRLLRALYDSLTVRDGPQPADLIFVMAGGGLDRKRYGLELFNAGFAPVVVVSVARSEANRLFQLELSGLDELMRLRDATPPRERHFFLQLSRDEMRVWKSGIPSWSTYGEILGLSKIELARAAKHILVVSTDIHLRRVRSTVDRVFPGDRLYCPVPVNADGMSRENWWKNRVWTRLVLSETCKSLGYPLRSFFVTKR